MRRLATICTMFGVFVIGLMLVLPVGQAADASKDLAVKMVLLTAKAARTVYVKGVIADAKKAGVKLSENWVKDEHAIMLPAQFVKELGKKIKNFELGIVGTDPLYASNSPKSDAEKPDSFLWTSKFTQDGGETWMAIMQPRATCYR